jgi:hypothetical protein
LLRGDQIKGFGEGEARKVLRAIPTAPLEQLQKGQWREPRVLAHGRPAQCRQRQDAAMNEQNVDEVPRLVSSRHRQHLVDGEIHGV